MTQKIIKTYFVAGTHCRACQILLERHIGSVPGVRHVNVDFRTGAVRVRSEHELDDTAVHDAIRAAGYQPGQSAGAGWISTDSGVWQELIVAGVVVFTLWLVASAFGLTKIATSVRIGAGPMGALIGGLVAGVSTCMALVGGLVLSISARHAQRHPQASGLQRFRPHMYFNAGRLAAFAVLGGSLGAVGAWAQPSVSATGWLIILTGAVMLLLGLSLTGAFPRLGSGLTLPAWLGRLFGLHRQEQGYSHRGAVFAGVATFFLPCGFTQAMQVAAVASGSFWSGMAIMTAFAVGTAPGLLGIGGLSSALRGATGRFMYRCIGLIVIGLALWNMSNGWNLTGIVIAAPIPSGTAVAAVVAPIEDGRQVVRMDQWAGGYNPSRFTVRRGIPVRWEVNSQDQYGCSSSLTIPSLGIRRNLTAGLNVIEFTPDRAGSLAFSCSMGMYRGVFNVIN